MVEIGAIDQQGFFLLENLTVVLQLIFILQWKSLVYMIFHGTIHHNLHEIKNHNIFWQFFMSLVTIIFMLELSVILSKTSPMY